MAALILLEERKKRRHRLAMGLALSPRSGQPVAPGHACVRGPRVPCARRPSTPSDSHPPCAPLLGSLSGRQWGIKGQVGGLR